MNNFPHKATLQILDVVLLLPFSLLKNMSFLNNTQLAGCSGYKPATAAWCSLPLSYNLSPWGYRNHHFVEQQPNAVKWRYNQPLYKTVTPPCQSFLYKWLLFFPYTVSMVAQSFPYQWLLYPCYTKGCTIIPVPVRVPVTVPMVVQFLQCTIT